MEHPPLVPSASARGAIFDASGRYRYLLWRRWDTDRPAVAFILLNPSTACAEQDDPTIRRCAGFARTWGFGGVEVANLFAYRATHPHHLKKVCAPEGPRNDAVLAALAARAGVLVAAWGNHGAFYDRAARVRALLTPGADVRCAGLTRMGHPRHVLYLPRDTPLVPYRT